MSRLLKSLVAVSAIALLAIGFFVFTERGQDVLLERFAVVGVAGNPLPSVDGLRVFMCGTSSPMPAPDRAQAIEGVVDFLNGNFHEPQRIDEMAERCGMSPRRFTELFKVRTGQTFSYYLNALRINFAKERLQQTGHILYACHESGFNDLAYFYRVFKKHTGRTPGDYLDGL